MQALEPDVQVQTDFRSQSRLEYPSPSTSLQLTSNPANGLTLPLPCSPFKKSPLRALTENHKLLGGFYQKHAPEKMDRVSSLLSTFDPSELHGALLAKYGESPFQVGGETQAGAGAAVDVGAGC